jgi:hypothetical protein
MNHNDNVVSHHESLEVASGVESAGPCVVRTFVTSSLLRAVPRWRKCASWAQSLQRRHYAGEKPLPTRLMQP